MTDANTEEMHNVCEYIYWMDANGYDLKFQLNDGQDSQCHVSYQRKTFQLFDAHRELTLLPAYQLGQVLSDLASFASGETKLNESATFMNYFNMTGHKLDVDPKYFLFSAYPETVAPLLRLLGLQTALPLTPAASAQLAFDFFQQDGQFTVHAEIINGLTHHFDILKLDNKQFKQMVEEQLNKYAHEMGRSDIR